MGVKTIGLRTIGIQKPKAGSGRSWSRYWKTLISAVVENAAPTNVVLTFPARKPSLGVNDFIVTDHEIISATWVGPVLTLVLSTPVLVFEKDLILTFKTGQTATITNNVVDDTNTVGWYDSQELTTITKDGNNLVARWNDKLGSGRDLLQGTTGAKPIWSTNGILFDGSDDKMRASFALIQPEFIYIAFKIKSWVYSDVIFDGYTNASGMLAMASGTSPEISCNAGTSSLKTDYVINDKKGVLRVLFNGASSKIIANRNVPLTGNFGAANMGGFCLGSQGNLTNPANIEVQEVVIRKVADDAVTENSIYNYLMRHNNVENTQYYTLSEAVYKEEPDSIALGNVSFEKNTEEVINCGIGDTFVAKKVEDAYNLTGNDKIINCALENPELVRFVEDSVNCEVFDISDDYIYYGNTTALTFYRINKHTFADKVQFLLSGIWDGVNAATCPIESVSEMNDFGLLIQVDISDDISKVYKVPFAPQTSGVKTYNAADASLVLNINKRHIVLNKAWGLSCKGNRVFAVVYGAIGQAYLSEDYGNTFRCVFSMADSSINAGVPAEKMIFVDTKPDGGGGFGAIGGHPMKDTLTNPQSYDLWGITANTNLHSHGGCIDKYADRLWVVTGDGDPAVGIFYSDDWGYNWTLIPCKDYVPSTPKLYGCQFVTVITLQDCILFGTDGRGDGYWRLFRNRNGVLGRIENCYQFTGSNTVLNVIAGSQYLHSDGIILGTFAPDTAKWATVKGGIAATKNGHDFKKVYEDSFSLPSEATAEIGWRSLISINNNNEVIVKAKNGGIIKLDYVVS